AAAQNGLEGIMAKRKSAPYRSGTRTKDWYKIKLETRHEALICGYTKKRGTDRRFSSLLLGFPNENGLQYIGAVGTGFSAKQQEEILRKLKPLATSKSPFFTQPILKDDAQWVRPQLVCEVKYTERTKDGLMRHPSFQGLREDKSAPDINPEETHDPVKSATLTKGADEALLSVENHKLALTNLRKIYWPRERITKGDLLRYYEEIAPFILPYMLHRPQSLNRFPNGINGESFYQKNMRGKVEPWLKTFERFSDSDEEGKDFLVCTGEASLLYMANLGCIEMNPWHSRVESPHYPDWCVIDLDPGNNTFNQVIEAAQVTHNILVSLGVESFPKTSGSTGIHIYIPLGGKYNYEQSRQLAELLVTLVHGELPKTTSLLRSPQKRKDKIYLDFLQNRPIQTICAPYSVRPKPGATVSAPLLWEEVKKGLAMSRFTLKNMMDRVRSEGDLFEGVLKGSIDLNEVLKTLARVI
ncbi:MAG: DNA ligase D, partial [Chitinophagaceae bacterium]